MEELTREILEDMQRCWVSDSSDYNDCEDCKAKEVCLDKSCLLSQCLSLMDRVAELEKELLFKGLSPEGVAMLIKTSTNEKAKADAEAIKGASE